MHENLRALVEKLAEIDAKAKPPPWTWVDDEKGSSVRVDASEREDLSPWLIAGEAKLGQPWCSDRPDGSLPKRIRDGPEDSWVLDYAGCGSHACDSKPIDRVLISSTRNSLSTLVALARLALEARDFVNLIEANVHGLPLKPAREWLARLDGLEADARANQERGP